MLVTGNFHIKKDQNIQKYPSFVNTGTTRAIALCITRVIALVVVVVIRRECFCFKALLYSWNCKLKEVLECKALNEVSLNCSISLL